MLIKYMGSKSRITKYIVPIIQSYINENHINTYIEPFVGGANVIDKIKCPTRIGYDLNKYLIALFRHIQKNGLLYNAVPKELYDMARNAVKSGDTSQFEDWQIGNIGFLASYNGRWFDGGYAKSGYEKTKSGLRYRNYYREASDNLLKQSKNLRGISFGSCDYRCVTPVNSVVYCDPPYANTKKFANAQNFNYEEFWDVMRKWSRNNVVIVSEQSAPEDWKVIWEQNVSRSIKAVDKSVATEKLFIIKD